MAVVVVVFILAPSVMNFYRKSSILEEVAVVTNPNIGARNWTVAILFTQAIDFVTSAAFVRVGVFVKLGVRNTCAALAKFLVKIACGEPSLLGLVFLLGNLSPLGGFLAVAFTGSLGLFDGGGDLLGVTLGGDMRPPSLVQSMLHAGDEVVDFLGGKLAISGSFGEFLDAFEVDSLHLGYQYAEFL